MTATPPPSPDRDHELLLDLAGSYCDGTIDREGLAWLESRLAEDAHARQAFLRYALLHAQIPLAEEARASRIAPASLFPGLPPLEKSSAGGRTVRGWGRVALLLAVIGGLAVAGWMAGIRASRPASFIATVDRAVGVVSADDADPLRAGVRLGPGRHALKSGAMSLVLVNGVKILVEGPCELELIDSMRAFLHSGAAVVRVPKGMRGFVLSTATTDVVDLGTEFAVKAAAGMVTDVQVYDGAVVASGRSSVAGRAPVAAGFLPRRIEAGEAARFLPELSAAPQPLPFCEQRFLRGLPPEPATGDPVRAVRSDDHLYGVPTIDRIAITPAAGPVLVDGRLEDWHGSVPFRAAYDDAAAASAGRRGGKEWPRGREWIEGRMMYDRENLYLAARVGDPAPLRSCIDPLLDPEKGWVGGGVQVRISTDRLAGWPVAGNSPAYYTNRNLPVAATAAERAAADNPKLCHLTMWHHAPSGRACLALAHGMTAAEACIANPEGFRGVFVPAPDGAGYVLEYAIPWRVLDAADDPPRAGDVLATAWQVHFADETGQIWRRQILEVRNLLEPRRIYVFQRAATWGRAEFQ